ncbi:MAG: 30S ribosomal protein S3 [Mollicutes bacterium PWAP]|nr:30S ribosomal protein S3 [Mollicutes bacterium PWAP]
MGQKVNPNSFRYGVTKKHNTNWFAGKENFSKFLLEDDKIYKFVDKFVRTYKIGEVKISRNNNGDVILTVYTAAKGELLGENGVNLVKWTKQISKATKNNKLKLEVKVIEISKPELNARLVAEDIAIRLENRGSFKAAQKSVIRQALFAGTKGIKTQVSGRLNGADMARTEGYSEGEMKLHTIRQDVDFAMATARTTYGALGIKVWISKGEILEGGNK